MSTDSLDTFVGTLRDSQLLDDAQLSILDALQKEHPDPEALARALLERGCLTRWQAEQLVRHGPDSLVLGQYVLVEPLGEGGMGQVFLARHLRMKRRVAIKVIRNDTPASAADVQRFAKEIEAAAALSHPNVVMAFDANEAGGVLYFVMEYVEGIDLGRLVKERGPLPVGQACEYVRQAALGLQHAADKGLVHRDIKPSNLLLTFADATVKVLDLGLARFQQTVGGSGSELTRTGTVMGTPDFISPEQARDARSVDIRSDLYSLGCTLYYLLSGRVPFPEGTFTEKLLKHNMDEPRPLAELRPEVPAEVHAIVRRLMAKQPEDRYQTPAELAEVLGPFAEAQRSAETYRPRPRDGEVLTPTIIPTHLPLVRPVPPGSPSGSRTGVLPPEAFASSAQWQTLPGERRSPASIPAAASPESGRRRRARYLVLAVLGLIAVGAGGVLAWLPRQDQLLGVVVAPHGPGTPDPAAAGPSQPGPASEKAPPTMARQLPEPPPKVDPEPKPPPLGVIVRLRERERDRGKGETFKAGLARDGRWALATWGGHGRLWDLDNLRPEDQETAGLEFDPSVTIAVTAAAVAGDGRRVVFAVDSEESPPPKGKKPAILHEVVAWVPGKPRESLRLPGHQASITCLALSPRGNFALSGSDDRTVRLWNLETGEQKHSLAHGDRVSCVAYSADGAFALSGGPDKAVVLWDLETGQRLHTFTEHETTVTCVAFSADGRFALSGSHDRKVCLYDLEKRQRVRSFEGHAAAVRCLAFTPDGRHFLSGDEDGTLRLWSAAERENLKDFKDHKKAIAALAVAPDGRHAVTLSADNTIQRWLLPLLP